MTKTFHDLPGKAEKPKQEGIIVVSNTGQILTRGLKWATHPEGLTQAYVHTPGRVKQFFSGYPQGEPTQPHCVYDGIYDGSRDATVPNQESVRPFEQFLKTT